MALADEPTSERVLVLTPLSRDAELVRARIVRDGMACDVCADLEELRAGIAAGAGAAVIAEEALHLESIDAIVSLLEAQAPWSDIPILLLLTPGRARLKRRTLHLGSAESVFERANVTLLQRPLSIRLFVSSVRSAVRARRRQYEMRRLHRDLERAVQLSDMFVSILGHDLRNPLSAIKLAADGIVRGGADSRVLRPAGRILVSADRMARMIEQILDFARARQGRGFPLRPHTMHLAEVCQQAIQELEDANPETQFQLTEMGDVTGVWDSDRIAQVISNLVGNAVKYGARGEPIIIEVDGADPSSVRLFVRNVGTIPADALPTIFEAFKQARQNATRTGLGLGLFIAREIARAHGGDVDVSSAAQRTTFIVTLPRVATVVDTGALTAR